MRQTKENSLNLILREDKKCRICMKINTKVVLPKCSHSMCMKCYRSWHARSQSCPFCRDSLKRVNSGDFWIYNCKSEIVNLPTIARGA